MKKIIYILISNFLLFTQMVKSQEIIAHRGASYLAPENTLAAVKLGYELGADAVEVDVHLSKDGKIMVNHDKDTKRTSLTENLLVKETDSKKLRKLDVGTWKDPKYKEEKMPFLNEVLQLVPQDKKLVIELKTGPEILPHLEKIISRYKNQKNLVIISFGMETIIGTKKIFPNIPAYWLLHSFDQYSLEEAIKIALDHQLNGLNVYYKLIDKEFMDKMKKAGLDVYTYTVNDPEVAIQLGKLQVKGITTDKPDLIKEQFSNK